MTKKPAGKKPLRIFLTDTRDEKTCGGCNWRSSGLYWLAPDKKTAWIESKEAAADSADDKYGYGLCPNCLVEHMVNDLKIEI
jgi:hypothetical protein